MRGPGEEDWCERIRVDRASEDPATAVRPMTSDQFAAFYMAEYPKLVKLLVLLGATIDEAEDAAQKAMADLFRSEAAPASAGGWVQRAAFRFFIKERQRNRKRMPLELQGGHLVIGTYIDDQLTRWEDLEDIEVVLNCLTHTQRQVIQLVMEGLSTPEIAEKLRKNDATIRQHLKKSRDRLKIHPQIAPLAPSQQQGPRKEVQ